MKRLLEYLLVAVLAWILLSQTGWQHTFGLVCLAICVATEAIGLLFRIAIWALTRDIRRNW